MRKGRSRLRSSRGHVRVEQDARGVPRRVALAAVLAIALITALIVFQQILSSSDRITLGSEHNATWLEFAWTANAVSPDAVRQLGARLRDHAIDTVYVEASAWRTDGTLLEGQYVQDFVTTLREILPDVRVLLWLRMSVDQIANPDQQAMVVALADKALHQWGLDGVQLNGLAVASGSSSYVELLRSLRDLVGAEGLLSVTVPPDRIPSDPDVPVGSTSDPELTWSVSYKQRIGLLGVDEVVIMAHASGLDDGEDYTAWVRYQLSSYISALSGLEEPVEIVVAVPTYDAGPEHDPAVETVEAALAGVRAALQDRDVAAWLRGVGLFEYKTTDSREWSVYRERWLGRGSD